MPSGLASARIASIRVAFGIRFRRSTAVRLEPAGQPLPVDFNPDGIRADLHAPDQADDKRPNIVGRSIAQRFRDPAGAFDQLSCFDATRDLFADRIKEFAVVGEQGAESGDDQCFEVAGRYPPAAGGGLASAGNEPGRDVVPVARALLDGMGGRQSLTILVKQETGQEARLLPTGAARPLDAVFGQCRLNPIPQVLIDDCRVLSGIGRAFVFGNGVDFSAVIVRRAPITPPRLRLTGDATNAAMMRGVSEWQLTISHAGSIAGASAIVMEVG
jgi:hypothetical protein